ncbi:MAG: hypothetical protein C5B54_02155 [Acidobacteria bacterium]|nr:MAG: hypothetical protein C5B54_02155 [Acidobacteriota bacterium]
MVPLSAFTQRPTKSELQSQMHEMTNDLSKQIADVEKQLADARKTKSSPETIKNLEDQLSMMKKQLQLMGGVANGLSKMSNKVVQQAVQEDVKPKYTVPPRDNARIKQLPDGVLSDEQLIPFAKNVVAEVDKKISASDKAKATEVYDAMMKSKYNSPNTLANVANTCWLNGYPEIALCIMGKVCLADMSNGNNLNNYAAFLTMMGGDHAAIPILQNLNQKFPNNSSILNNLGQAWYGLGDMTQSKKYLDQSMHLYALNSEANLTNARICKSQGNNQEAMQSVKRAIEEDYTPEKENELNDLGGELSWEDIPFPYPGPADTTAEPLSFQKFIATMPEYAMDAGAAAETLHNEWYSWKQNLRVPIEQLLGQSNEVKEKWQAYVTKARDNPALLKPYNNSVHNTAVRKLQLMMIQENEKLVKLAKKMKDAEDTIKQWRTEYEEKLKDPGGCGGAYQLAKDFNVKANNLWHDRNNELLGFLKQYYGEWARLSLYATTDRSEYEFNIASIKSQFLDVLAGLKCEYEVGCDKKEPENKNAKELPDFDEMNCTYKQEIMIWPFTKMKFDCNKWTTEIGVELNFNYGLNVSPYVKFEIEENLRTGRTTKGTIEVGGESGIKGAELELGPLKGEAVIKGGAGIELTEHGIESVYIKGGVGSNAINSPEGADVTNYGQISAQAEARMTWESGSEKIGAESGTGEGHFSSSAEVKVPLLDAIKIGGAH